MRRGTSGVVAKVPRTGRRSPIEPRSSPRIIGHRGASGTHPENTMMAFEAALADGADGIEFDVQLSSDGIPIVHHDRTLKKIAGRPRRVHAFSWDELRGVDAGSWFAPEFRGERIPSLDAVLDAFGGRTTSMLEIKVDGEGAPARRAMLVDRCVGAVLRRKLTDRVFVLSFDLPALRRVKRLAPALRCVLDVDRAPVPSRSWLLRMADVDAVCMPARVLRRSLRATLAQAGLEVWVYRCDTELHLAQAMRWNVDAVVTDWPAWARAGAKRRGAASRRAGRSSTSEG